MNNENQTNQNSVGGMDATSLGAAPMPTTPTPNENLNQMPVSPATENLETNVAPNMPAASSVASDLANPVMVNAVENPNLQVNSNPEGAVNNSNAVENPLPNNAKENLEPIAQPIPGTNPAFSNNDMNVNSNSFVESQKLENVGTDVPNKPEKEPKKGMNKILFVVIIIALLAAIAVGVYFYLNLGNSQKSKVKVTAKNIEVEVNQPLSTNLADYATFNDVDSKNCRLITSNVDITKAGTYEYSITCGTDVFKANVIVVNNTVLSVSTKTIYTNILAEGASNNNLTVDKFVDADSCTGSECKYAFNSSFDLNNSLKTPGNYLVPIDITDVNGATATVNANLRVFENLKVFINCRDDQNKITDKFAINDVNTFAGYAVRVSEFSFANDEEYQAAVGSKGETITYNNVTGKATYDDQNKILTIETELTLDDLNKEAGGTFPSNFAEINTYYTNKSYACTIAMDNIINP